MRAAPMSGRRYPAALLLLLFLLLTPACPGTAIAGDATPQAIAEAADVSARPAPHGRIPRIVEFTIVPPESCDPAGVVHAIVGLQDAGRQPAWVQLSLTAIDRATGRELEVDTRILPAAVSIAVTLEADLSGPYTGLVARVRLLDATNTTLQTRLHPVHLPCEERAPGSIMTLPVTGTGSGNEPPFAMGLVALAATIILIGVETARQCTPARLMAAPAWPGIVPKMIARRRPVRSQSRTRQAS